MTPEQLAAKNAAMSSAPVRLPRERACFLAVEIYALGPRPLAELFLELDRGAELPDAPERYAAIRPYANFIRAHGRDRITPARLATSRGRRRP